MIDSLIGWCRQQWRVDFRFLDWQFFFVLKFRLFEFALIFNTNIFQSFLLDSEEMTNACFHWSAGWPELHFITSKMRPAFVWLSILLLGLLDLCCAYFVTVEADSSECFFDRVKTGEVVGLQGGNVTAFSVLRVTLTLHWTDKVDWLIDWLEGFFVKLIIFVVCVCRVSVLFLYRSQNGSYIWSDWRRIYGYWRAGNYKPLVMCLVTHESGPTIVILSSQSSNQSKSSMGVFLKTPLPPFYLPSSIYRVFFT